jgi:hypothetical protein
VKIAVDVLFFRQRPDEIDEADALPENGVSALNAVASRKSPDSQLVETRSQHAAVASACAISGKVRLAHEHGLAGLRQHARRAQAGEAAADNQDIDLARQFHQRFFRPRGSLPPVRVFVQVFEYISHAEIPMSLPRCMLCCIGYPGQEKQECKTTVSYLSFHRY